MSTRAGELVMSFAATDCPVINMLKIDLSIYFSRPIIHHRRRKERIMIWTATSHLGDWTATPKSATRGHRCSHYLHQNSELGGKHFQFMSQKSKMDAFVVVVVSSVS